MARSFVIGDTGEEVIVATWHPDPEVLEEEIMLMANEFDDWTAPLQEAKQALISGTERRFDTETDPENVAWQALDEDYYRRKTRMMAGPDKILQLSESLKDAATSEEAWFITESSIFFNAEALPKNPEDNVNYGMAHQAGTGFANPGSRSHMKLEAFSALVPLEGSGVLNKKQTEFLQAHSGRGKHLPARPFIGVDFETEDEIVAIFTRHLDRTVTNQWNAPIADLPDRMIVGSNVEGTFPIIGFLSTGQPRLSTGRFGRKL